MVAALGATKPGVAAARTSRTNEAEVADSPRLSVTPTRVEEACVPRRSGKEDQVEGDDDAAEGADGDIRRENTRHSG